MAKVATSAVAQEQIMAKFSDKRMGKEVGNAMVYAKPHTMKGKAVGIEPNPGKDAKPQQSRHGQHERWQYQQRCG
jgi:hypothetical protein